MAKEKKNNALIYAVIAVVVVVAVVVGIVIATKNKGGDTGDGGGNGGTSETTSKADDYKNIDIVIESGDYDAMEALAKDIQNGEATGKVVKIDGFVSHPLSAYSVVVPNEDETKKIGTQFVIDGDGEYPSDGDHIIITGKVVEASPLFYVIQTIPELLVVQND